MSNRRWLGAILLCLSAITANAFDTAWYTYVDHVESVNKAKRDISDPATPSPLDVTTPHNETELVWDDHDYYVVEYIEDVDDHWMDMNKLGSPLVVSERLSSSTRHAVRLELNFTFPFYGYDTKFIHVTSSGFLYVGSYSHKYLAATQYVAPLMADFDPSLHNGSTISYYGDDSMFVTEWRNLRLQEDTTGMNFTFQAIIYKNGTTVFAYKEKPTSISVIPSEDHPVKVGLADAFYHDTWIIKNIISRRVIYEYHSVEVPFPNVDASSVIILKPLETCTARMTCSTCNNSPPAGFNCTWCSSLNSCSDGFDRNRQAWLKHDCEKKIQTVCPGDENPDNNDASCLTLNCGPGTCTPKGCVCPENYYGQECQSYKTQEMAPTIQTTANSVERFIALTEEHKGKRIIALFCGSPDSENGESWCPDCVKAEPVVEKVLKKASDDIIFVLCIVGDRQTWKDPNCEFRTNKRLRLTGVPTLLEWNKPKKLVEGDCQKEDLVSMFFEED